MSALGSLVVKLGLDYAQYTGGLDKSEQAALAASKKIQDTFDGMKARVAATAGAIAGGLAAGFTIAAFKNIISGSIETGAALDDLRMQTGASVEALSGLMAVGKFNNMGPEQIGGAMTKLASNLAGATEESKGTGKAIEALGLDFEKFKQLRPEDQMQTVAKAMAQFEDGTGKSAVAMALYGKQGAAMLPFLHDLAEVGDLQAKVTTEQAAAAANLDDNLTRLSTSGEGWKRELANGMIPALDLGAQALVDMMNGSGGLRDEVKKLSADGSIKQWTSDAIKGLSYVADVGQIAWRVLQSIGKGMGGFAAALVQALGGDFRGAWASLQESGKDMIDVFDGPTVGARFRESMDKVSASAAAAGAAGADAGKKLDFTNVLAKNTKAATEAKDPFDTLRDSIVKSTAAYQAEATAGEKLTEGQKKSIDVLDQIRTGKVKVTEAQAIQIGKDIEAMLAAEGENKAREEFIKSADAERAVRLKMVQGMEQAAVSLEASNQAMREEIELIGLSTEQQTLVLQQRNDVIILTKEATLAELERQSAITGTQTRVEIALASEIEALKERNALLGAKGVKNAAVDAAKTAKDEWQKTTDSINQSLTDALLRGFESGKDFAKNLRDTVVNMFKTLILRPIISAVVNPVAGAITGALGLSGAANAGSSALSTAGSIGSGYSALAGIGGAFGGGLSGGFGGLMGSLGLSATGSTLGGALSAGGIALQSGNILGGLGTLVGALGPIALGIGALAAIFGKDDSGTYHTGGAGSYSAAGGSTAGKGTLNQGLQFGVRFQDYNDASSAAAANIAKSIATLLDSTAESFGNKAGYFAATAYADDAGSKDKAWGELLIKRVDETIINWRDSADNKWAGKQFSDGEAGQKEYSAALALSVRDALVGAVEGVDWAQSLLTGLGDAPTLEGLQGVVATINAAQAAFASFGQYMPIFTDLTNAAVSSLVDASGGAQALSANMGTFVENFYTDAEKLAINTQNVRDAISDLGFEMPKTRDDFRALLEAQIALGESGAATAAGLLGLSGAFASVVPAAAEATAALQAQAEAMEGLQIKLLRAQGNELAAVAIERQKELAALQDFGPAAVAMQQHIYGIMDAMSALESGAAAYFAGVDRQKAAEDYTDQGSDALRKFFGTAADASAGAAASAAQASADAASTAAASWRSAAQSIQSAIDGLRSGTTDAMDPAARYALTKATFDAYTVSALGGDADAASKLSGAANDFLKASESGSTTQAQYLRDRVLAESKLASVMSSAQAQASVQDTIAASAGAAVTQLEAMNANLTGFSSTLYELLSTQYQGADRGTAEGVASTFGQMQADFDAYFKDFKTGSTYTDAAFNGGSFTRLSGDMAAYTDSDGVISYLRATESILDIAKRIPELRQAWEQQYGLKLPGYAVGTSYVPVTGPALLHEGEAVIPKAFNPWAGGGMQQGGNGEMLAELRALRQTNERLEARLASIEESNRDMATLLDNVTEGGNAMRSEVMA